MLFTRSTPRLLKGLQALKPVPTTVPVSVDAVVRVAQQWCSGGRGDFSMGFLSSIQYRPPHTTAKDDVVIFPFTPRHQQEVLTASDLFGQMIMETLVEPSTNAALHLSLAKDAPHRNVAGHDLLGCVRVQSSEREGITLSLAIRDAHTKKDCYVGGILTTATIRSKGKKRASSFAGAVGAEFDKKAAKPVVGAEESAMNEGPTEVEAPSSHLAEEEDMSTSTTTTPASSSAKKVSESEVVEL